MLRTFNFSRFKKEFNMNFLSLNYSEETGKVREIITEVREKGDSALYDYTSRFDGAVLSEIKATENEKNEAGSRVTPELKKAIREAVYNIEKFHLQQVPRSFWSNGDGILLGQVYRPLERAGAYVPGGTASYPSSVLMTVIPARIAGVKEIYVCTPPGPDGKADPVTLYAAMESGAKEVFKIGGAQAVAAMAYGTESVPRVEKIVGPGNIYVTLAKKEVFGDVGIDMLAGPSEIMIVADSTGRPDYIAADLLSQSEHDPSSRSFLVTADARLAGDVEKELDKQIDSLPRKDIAERSLREQGGIILVSDLDEAWEAVNLVAPEHLELYLEEPWRYIDKIKNAGSIFLGPYSPEPLGDYWAGANHVLPTGGAARFSSPLGVNDFIKYSQVIMYSREALGKAASCIESIAGIEGLDAHARSIKIRGKEDGTKL